MSIIKIRNRSEAFASRGRIMSFKVVSIPDYNSGLREDWTVFSNGKLSVLTRYLQGKLVWDELSATEQEVLYQSPYFIKDITIYSVLKARVLGIPMKIIRERLEKLSKLKLIQFITKQQFQSINGMCFWFLLKETNPLPKVPKYSGYTKHYKDKGSLRGEEIFPELFEFKDIFDIESLICDFLVVGEFPLLGYTLPDEIQMRIETTIVIN